MVVILSNLPLRSLWQSTLSLALAYSLARSHTHSHTHTHSLALSLSSTQLLIPSLSLSLLLPLSSHLSCNLQGWWGWGQSRGRSSILLTRQHALTYTLGHTLAVWFSVQLQLRESDPLCVCVFVCALFFNLFFPSFSLFSFPPSPSLTHSLPPSLTHSLFSLSLLPGGVYMCVCMCLCVWTVGITDAHVSSLSGGSSDWWERGERKGEEESRDNRATTTIILIGFTPDMWEDVRGRLRVSR